MVFRLLEKEFSIEFKDKLGSTCPQNRKVLLGAKQGDGLHVQKRLKKAAGPTFLCQL